MDHICVREDRGEAASAALTALWVRAGGRCGIWVGRPHRVLVRDGLSRGEVRVAL
jgi:hypothetical protein